MPDVQILSAMWKYSQEEENDCALSSGRQKRYLFQCILVAANLALIALFLLPGNTVHDILSGEPGERSVLSSSPASPKASVRYSSEARTFGTLSPAAGGAPQGRCSSTEIHLENGNTLYVQSSWMNGVPCMK